MAPMLASMLGGPLAGTAVTALEGAMGLTAGSGEVGITAVIQGGNMTPETLAAVRAADQKHTQIMSQQQVDVQKMNLDYQKAMAEVDVADVTSARTSNVQGGTTKYLFVLSTIILAVTIGSEVAVLFGGVKAGLSDIIVGRVLGLMDAATMMVLSYWYGTTHSSAQKNVLLANSEPVKGK